MIAKRSEMKQGPVDYGELGCFHRMLAERLCSPYAGSGDWERFYAELWDYVARHFGTRLENLCGISVGDFLRGELTQYFIENQCDKLRRFLALPNEPDEPQHFFRKWFRMQIQAAYNKVEQRQKDLILGGGPEEILTGTGTKGKNAADADDKANEEKKPKKSASAQETLKAYLKREGRHEFSSLVSLFWCKTPTSKKTDGKKFANELYTVVMLNILGFPHRKIATLVGHVDDIASAGSERNFWRAIDCSRELYKRWRAQSEAINETSAYSADGREDEDAIKALGKTLCTICYDGRHEDASKRWRLDLHIPPKVEPGFLIRGVLQDHEGNVPKGTLFVCGKERLVRENGCFEFPVSEFTETARYGEVHFTWSDGERVDGILHIPTRIDHIVLSRRLLDDWASRKMSEEDPIQLTAEILNDFGLVLPLLILSDKALSTLPFKMFGVEYPDRKQIARSTSETLVLFRTGLAVDPDSPLSSDGFALPLEWRPVNITDNVLCDSLPQNLIALSENVKQRLAKTPVRLWPSRRFFDDRVDFSSPEIFGGEEDSVASAFGALAVGLRYHERRYTYPVWPFVSLAYDCEQEQPRPVGGIAQKIALARSFGASRVLVAAGQTGLPIELQGMLLPEAHGANLDQTIDSVAYSHLSYLEPTTPVQFKTTGGDYEERRRKVYMRLSQAAHKPDPDAANPHGPFVVLFGKPGMGKSILMSQLRNYLGETEANKCFAYICMAGRENQGVEFAKSIAHAVGCRCAGCLPESGGEDFHGLVLHGAELKAFYRKWVVGSLLRFVELGKQRGQLYLLVDGLDEDPSGEVLELLTDEETRLPKCVSVVVSTRRIVEDEDRLASVLSDEVDLNGDDPELARDCHQDLGAYIQYWPLRNNAVRNQLIKVGMTPSELSAIILSHEQSFLYAYYVLHGLAEGRYAVETLGKDIPKDLKACFADAFRARFPRPADYDFVRPLLKTLTPTGRASVAEARKTLPFGMAVGAVVKALRGYVAEEGHELVLTSKPLRDWLKDDLHNPEFAIV